MKILNFKDADLNQLKKYQEIDSDVLKKVKTIIEQVRKNGDEALKKLTLKYDLCRIPTIKVDIKKELKNVPKPERKLQEALQLAIRNLRKVAQKQYNALKKSDGLKVETQPGVVIEQKIIPIKRVGIYVPGGRYPLISSLYMAAVPAIEAGVKEIMVCTPPAEGGMVRPEILYLADLLGIEELYRAGGAQAIAAMALGTETIAPVDKIVGPGNIYVTAAKKLLYGKVDVDFIAGPTELLVIADDSARADLIAADLLAQAEHDVLARPILVSLSPDLTRLVEKELKSQLAQLPDPQVASRALQDNCWLITCSSPEEACRLANSIAPEHLLLCVRNVEKFINRLSNCGCLFVGQNSAEVFGDYCAGTNHILPTNAAARYTGGLHPADFVKFVCSLRIEGRAVKSLSGCAALIARAEGLVAHAKSAEKRCAETKSRI